jgi:AcrR family transcriptional regulator
MGCAPLLFWLPSERRPATWERRLGRRRRSEESDTREQILDEAERLIAARGYEGLRLKDVADAIGIQVPSIYGHFQGRDGVLAALALRYVSGMQELFAYDGATNPTRALVECVRAYVHHWAMHPAHTRLRLRDLETREAMPELALGRESLAPMFNRLEALLEDGRALGEFREIDPMRFWRDLTGATLVALCYPEQAVLNGSSAPGELDAIVAGLEDLALRLVRP